MLKSIEIVRVMLSDWSLLSDVDRCSCVWAPAAIGIAGGRRQRSSSPGWCVFIYSDRHRWKHACCFFVSHHCAECKTSMTPSMSLDQNLACCTKPPRFNIQTRSCVKDNFLHVEQAGVTSVERPGWTLNNLPLHTKSKHISKNTHEHTKCKQILMGNPEC